MQLNVFQILLRVQFSLLGGFGIQSQHFVLKIFSESQSEQQGIELGIFNSISDKEKWVYSSQIIFIVIMSKLQKLGYYSYFCSFCTKYSLLSELTFKIISSLPN